MKLRLAKPNLKLKIRATEDTLFQILLCFIWCESFLISYIKAFVMRIPIIGVYSDEIETVCVCISVLFALGYILKRINKSDIIVLAVVVCVLLLNLLIYSGNRHFQLPELMTFLTSVFSLYFIGLCLDQSHIEYLYKLSALNIILCVFYILFFGESMDSVQALNSGNMYTAYKILPHICMVTYKAFEGKKTAILYSVVGFILLFSFGSRGPVLLYVLFAVIDFMFLRTQRNKWAVNVAVIALFVVVVIFMDFILSALNDIALSLGLSNRIFEMLLRDELSTDSGRWILQARVLAGIMQKPILGYGIAGDRLIIGTYSHNVILELWASFGVVIGSLLLLCLCVLMVRSLIVCNPKMRVMILILAFCSFLKLFLSSTYLNEALLFMMIGVCVAQIRADKKIKVKKRSAV